MIETISLNSERYLINTESLTQKENQILQTNYHLNSEIIAYVNDQDESPNYIYDKINKDQLLIMQIPYCMDSKKLQYITQPIELLIHQNNLFIFNPCGNKLFTKIFNDARSKIYSCSNKKIILMLLFEIIDSFLPVIKNITRRRNLLDETLNKSIKNNNLVFLSHLQQTLSFFSSAIALNVAALKRLSHTSFLEDSIQVNENEEMLDDVLIESQQVQQMVEIELEIVQRITETFNVIANNNLNDTMKFLTIWSLILTVPTIITGFFGMNVSLPWTKLPTAWIIIILICIILSLWLLLVLKIHKKL